MLGDALSANTRCTILANRALALDALEEPAQALDSARRARCLAGEGGATLDALCSQLEAAALAEKVERPPPPPPPPAVAAKPSPTSGEAPPPSARPKVTWAQMTQADPFPTHVPGGRAPPSNAQEAAVRAVSASLCEQANALLMEDSHEAAAQSRAQRQALALFSTALRYDGDNPEAWRGRAMAHLALSAPVTYAHLAAADAFEAIERDAAVPAGCGRVMFSRVQSVRAPTSGAALRAAAGTVFWRRHTLRWAVESRRSSGAATVLSSQKWCARPRTSFRCVDATDARRSATRRSCARLRVSHNGCASRRTSRDAH